MKKFNLNDELIQTLVTCNLLNKKNLRLDDKDLKMIYSKAKNLYDAGKYADARALFSTLTLLERNNPTFIFGLGSSALLLNEFDEAIVAFMQYAALVPDDPLVYFYISRCYEKKKDVPSTLIALQAVVERAGEKSKYRDVKNRALLVLNNFSKKRKESTKSPE